jgi:hypothetical protein
MARARVILHVKTTMYQIIAAFQCHLQASPLLRVTFVCALPDIRHRQTVWQKFHAFANERVA